MANYFNRILIQDLRKFGKIRHAKERKSFYPISENNSTNYRKAVQVLIKWTKTKTFFWKI